MRSRETIVQEIESLSGKIQAASLTGLGRASRSTAITNLTLIEIMLDIRDQQAEVLSVLRDVTANRRQFYVSDR